MGLNIGLEGKRIWNEVKYIISYVNGKKIIHSKFMHIFIAINCYLLHKYGHRKRLHRLWNHVLLLLYAAVKVVGGVNELYMLSTCQKCNNKAYVWGTQVILTQTNYILVLHDT